jgi:hypothetical protein
MPVVNTLECELFINYFFFFFFGYIMLSCRIQWFVARIEQLIVRDFNPSFT